MIIDCVADLHGHYPELEGGDLLIVAGDLTARDTSHDHVLFQIWLHDQNYRKKVVIAGNHDNRLQNLPFETIKRQYEEMGESYLCDSGTEFEGLKIWGSPWTTTFPGINPHCKAFTVESGWLLSQKWNLIPDNIDILVTHSPAEGHFDWVMDRKVSVGCYGLNRWINNHIHTLKLHVCGHIHEAYGVSDMRRYTHGDRQVPTIRVNASHVNERYEPVNKPIRIEL